MKTKLKKYRFDPNAGGFARFTDRAQEIGEAVEQIRAAEGAGDLESIPPQTLVEAARPKSSPLHDVIFDCPPNEAAEKHYLLRARQLVRSIDVEVVIPRKSKGQPSRIEVTRAFVKASPSGGYTSIQTALSSDQGRDYLLRQALRELQSFQEKFATLSELADVFSAINQVVKRSKREEVVEEAVA